MSIQFNGTSNIFESSADLNPNEFHPRDGKTLKEYWTAFKTNFKKPLDRWNTSGQNNPFNFAEFLDSNDMKVKDIDRKLYLFAFTKLYESDLLDSVAQRLPLGVGFDTGIIIY